MGLTLNQKKSHNEGQRTVDWLGIRLDMSHQPGNAKAYVPEEKVEKIRHQLGKFFALPTLYHL